MPRNQATGAFAQRGAARTSWLIGTVLGLVAFAVIATYLSLQQLQRNYADTTLPTVSLGPHHLGGLEPEALQRAVQEAAEELLAQPLVVTSGNGSVVAPRSALGLSIDVDATAENAWSRGRQNWWSALRDLLAARRGDSVEVGFESDVDDETFTEWTAGAAQNLSREPRPAGIGLIHAEEPDVVDIHVIEPAAGLVTSADDLAGQLGPPLESTFGPLEVEAPAQTIQPVVTMDDVDQVLPKVRLAVSAPVVLENPSAGPDLELSPFDLAYILMVRRLPEADPGERLRLAVEPDTFQEHLGDRLAALEASPIDASFDVTDDQVTIAGGLPGFELDVGATLEQVVTASLKEFDRRGQLAGEATPPEFSLEEAEALGIRERVSSFTTPYSCCPPRVDNIQLAADILNGLMMRPGERVSLNRAIGPRTRSRGFVSNGYIEDGELRTAVGGGVSQIGTTFFNAAWFAGIRLIDFKPHSLYIDRYPMGREATLDWNVIDVVVENNSPYGILLNTSYTSTSVTFEFWSTPWAEVETETIGPTNRKEGASRDGFDVTVIRTIHYPDGSTREEEHFHRYQPED